MASSSLAGLPTPDIEKQYVKSQIELVATDQGVDPELALKVAKCESGYVSTAKGDKGQSYGTYQFKLKTFENFKTEAKRQELNRKDTEDNIWLGIWGLKNGKESHWTCYRTLKRKGHI